MFTTGATGGVPMADDPKQPSPGLGGNAFLWLAVVAAVTAYFGHPAPLENLRPAVPELQDASTSTGQDIDARLWQDPFESVLKSVGDRYGWTGQVGIASRSDKDARNDHGSRDCSDPRTDQNYCSPLEFHGNRQADALGIMVPGSPYSEDAEFRRRVRYAVLSGLSIQGYVPVDAQHIGVFIPSQLSGMPRNADPSDLRNWEVPKFVPYEFVTKSSGPGHPLAIFWLDEDALSSKPLYQLARLFCQLKPPPAPSPPAQDVAARSMSVEVATANPSYEGGSKNPSNQPAHHFRLQIIGPQASTTLLAMVGNLKDLPNYEPSKDGQEQSNTGCPFFANGDQVLPMPHLFDRFEIYDYGATADAAALCRQSLSSSNSSSDTIPAPHHGHARCDTALLPASQDWLEQKFQHKGIRFRRAIASDDVLARSINAELQRHGINAEKPAQIALVSEWDTYYGRSLPNLFERCLTPGADPWKPEACDQRSSDVDIDKKTRERIYRFSYLRGLDGQTAASVASKRASAAAAPPASASDAPDNAAAPDGADQRKTSDAGVPLLSSAADGQGQGDYLLRLADELKEQDQKLWRAKGERLQAVGVLGDDVYDKLLVIQALRAALPRALFFTTDLDARLIHPGQGVWTRNLLVASGFGLSLRRELQRYVPPFRSSYQTAAFLATLMAAGPASGDPPTDPTTVADELNSAELFEIGRTQAIHLDDEKAEASQKHDGLGCADWSPLVDVFECGRLQPPEVQETPPRFVLALGLALVESVLAFAFLVLLLWLCCGRAYFSSRTSLVSGAVLFVLIFTALFTVQSWWPAIDLALSGNGNGELTTPLESVSLWPSIGLKLLSLVLGVALIVHVRRVSAANFEKLVELFGMTPLISEVEQEQSGRSRLALESPLRDAIPWRIRAAGDIDGPKAFWGRYVDYGRGWPQVLRVAIAVGLVMVLELSLYGVFGHGMPYRGWLAHDLYLGVAFVDSLTTAALVFYVADRTLFSWLFVKEAFADVSSQATSSNYVWSEESRKTYANRLGMAPNTPSDKPGEDLTREQDSVVAAIMSLNYVSKRTACVTNLIYYPFLMIGLMVLSRSTIFSSFPFDPVFVISQLLNLTVAFASAMALRRAAEDARRNTQQRLLVAKLKTLTSDQANGFNRQLDLLRERVAAFSEGAFSPLSHQPVVRALLLPLGSYGGTLLLSSLTSTNL